MNEWNLEGLCIEARYLDNDTVKVCGVVTLSRAKYGSGVLHHVTLTRGFSARGGRIKRDAGDTVIVDHEDVIRVYGGEER